jgi:hypothetical protein
MCSIVQKSLCVESLRVHGREMGAESDFPGQCIDTWHNLHLIVRDPSTIKNLFFTLKEGD